MPIRYHAGQQPPARRLPLQELHDRTNTPPTSRLQTKLAKTHGSLATSSPNDLPHNESLQADGSLAVRSSQPSSPENKRLSAIENDIAQDSKRNSAISTTSTNASGRKRKTFIGHWELGRTIGRGGCSRVRVVRHKYRDQLGAVKIITRSMAENTRAQSLANLIESAKGSLSAVPPGQRPIPYGLEREIAVMKLLEHPNIVKLYDVWENRNELYLIMEFVDGGELFHYVDMKKGLSEGETVFIFRQIISALLYCHRMLICHRDLKPENILLNQKDLTVKLIDFGMAALQPEGRLLSTPCGSPHYAAPEVVSSRPYDGKQADVWSCGVILYVMLTGTTPYNYSQEGDIRSLFRDIAKANYWMPPDLSPDAQDLIRKIFVPHPKKRITMDEVWDHPFVHKFDVAFGLDGVAGSKAVAVGPAPRIDQWKVKRIQDIDREILRNMRTLWHSDPEQVLIQKLLNDELNQEKLFYAALIKHREENLENFIGETHGVSYSASDYRHTQALHTSGSIPPAPPVQASRSQSQYSILHDEHLRPSHVPVPVTPSMSSYDPYKASRDPIWNGRGSYININVHRAGTSSTKASIARPLRHPNPTRIEMLKQAHRRSINLSSPSLARSAQSYSSMRRASTSRISLSSSVRMGSHMAITMRPSDLHKRGVSFGHLRRVSTTSAIATIETAQVYRLVNTSSMSGGDNSAQDLIRASLSRAADLSPAAYAGQNLRSRKEKRPSSDASKLCLQKTDTPGRVMRSEIRKHSAELEKACEEAFFRSSIGSSTTARTSLTEKPSPYDTPPSSISARGSDLPDVSDIRLSKVPARPLPDVPRDTPNTYLAKTLEETRSKLAAYRAESDENVAEFDDIVRLLGTLVHGNGASPSDLRIVSAPVPKVEIGSLPIISEDDEQQQQTVPKKQPSLRDFHSVTITRNAKDDANWQLSTTEPVQRDSVKADRTVRMVQPSPPAHVAPLNVRKRSSRSQIRSAEPPKLKLKTSTESLKRGINIDGGTHDRLPAIIVDSFVDTPTGTRKKLTAWLNRSKETSEVSRSTGGRYPTPAIEQLDDRQTRRGLRPSPTENDQENVSPRESPSSEFPMRQTRFAKGKAGLTKWISWMGREKESYVDDAATSPAGMVLSPADLQSLGLASTDRMPSGLSTSTNPGPSKSWFARFFHLKPASQILCFTVSRTRARQELYLLLREWQRHGIRDLQYHHPKRNRNGQPATNPVITARVDRDNTLQIKPVSFRIEVFVVLEHGRPAGLSIARFTQARGAASAFRKVLEVIDGVMRGRGWLVEEEEKWRALKEVIDDC